MKQEILNRLQTVILALNCVTVCGKANMVNQASSIEALESIVAILQTADINPPPPQVPAEEAGKQE